jgi:glyoxylase-like metal-dependent hydrolase (beta-lactamase superfamily II)
MQREAASYETNLYRLCGDWMKGTETLLANQTLPATAEGVLQVGQRKLVWRALKGHTESDLVLVDSASGVAFVGGLVFNQRMPTTPHANVADWLASLRALETGAPLSAASTVVPSHGPVHQGLAGLQGTQRFLQWLDAHFSAAAAQGLEVNELLRAPVPEEFTRWAAFKTEYIRNVAHLYPRYESAALAPK